MGEDWDFPRLAAWKKATGNLPPLQMMVGRYLGYKPSGPDAAPDTSTLTTEEHAQRLLGQLGIPI